VSGSSRGRVGSATTLARIASKAEPMSFGTVKSRMRYALEALRRELTEYQDYARSLS